jgi:hypothetical protein
MSDGMTDFGPRFIDIDTFCCICKAAINTCGSPSKCNGCSLFHWEYIEANGPTCPYELGEQFRAGKIINNNYKWYPS